MADKHNKDTWVNWDDEHQIRTAIENATSRVKAIENLGYYPKSAITRRKLNKAIQQFNIDTSHFSNIGNERWNKLPDIIHECFSISEVLRAVGLTDQGNNHKTAKRYIKEFNLDISHFETIKHLPGNKIANEDLFIEHSTSHRSLVKNRIIKEQLIEYKCTRCGNIGEWMGQQLTLQLEHKNGVNNDHRLENLEFLCPNCHTQTETWGQKKRNN